MLTLLRECSRSIRQRLGRIILVEQNDPSLVVRVEADVDDGGFVASVPGIPGVRSQGETEVEAVRNVIDAWTCAWQASLPDESIAAEHDHTPAGGHEHRLPIPA